MGRSLGNIMSFHHCLNRSSDSSRLSDSLTKHEKVCQIHSFQCFWGNLEHHEELPCAKYYMPCAKNTICATFGIRVPKMGCVCQVVESMCQYKLSVRELGKSELVCQSIEFSLVENVMKTLIMEC